MAVVGVAVAPPRSSVTVTGLVGVAELIACTVVETAALVVVWRVTEPPEDDGELLTTDWMLGAVASSTVIDVLAALAVKSTAESLV